MKYRLNVDEYFTYFDELSATNLCNKYRFANYLSEDFDISLDEARLIFYRWIAKTHNLDDRKGTGIYGTL